MCIGPHLYQSLNERLKYVTPTQYTYKAYMKYAANVCKLFILQHKLNLLLEFNSQSLKTSILVKSNIHKARVILLSCLQVSMAEATWSLAIYILSISFVILEMLKPLRIHFYI